MRPRRKIYMMTSKIPLVVKGKDQQWRSIWKKTTDCNVLAQHNHDFYLRRYLCDKWPTEKIASEWIIVKILYITRYYSKKKPWHMTCLSSIMWNGKICFRKFCLLQSWMGLKILKQLHWKCFMCWFWEHAAKRKKSG